MKAKFILTILIPLLLGFLISPRFSFAQHGGHSSGNMNQMREKPRPVKTINYAMHGGTVNPVGKYYIEMVYDYRLANVPIMFYLMNRKGKPISAQSITGKAAYTYSDGSNSTNILEAGDENGFAGPMPKKTSSFICLLTLKIDGENIATRFEGGSSGLKNASTAPVYTCSMHPEILSDKPGDCPKCGMSLVKKSNQ